MVRLAILGACVVLAACAPLPSLPEDPSLVGQVQPCFELWFATNREVRQTPKEGEQFGDGLEDAIRYGRRCVPLGGGVSTASAQPGKADHLSLPEWEEGLKTALAAPDEKPRDLVIYIHGFDNTFEVSMAQAGRLGAALKLSGPLLMFSWPSRGKAGPLSYLADLNAMDNSVEELGQILVAALQMAGPGRVHVIAHSMGCYGLLRTLNSPRFQKQLGPPGGQFGQLVLAAPDIDDRLFRRLISAAPGLARRVTVYVAEEDMAIKASEMMHGRPRVGPGTGRALQGTVDTVRVDGRADTFNLGHSYLREVAQVVTDISTLIRTGASLDERMAGNGFPELADASSNTWVIRIPR